MNIFPVVDQMSTDISAISLKYIEKAFSGKPTYDVLKTTQTFFITHDLVTLHSVCKQRYGDCYEILNKIYYTTRP